MLWPCISACRSRSVVNPNDLLALAYSSFPIRIQVSSNRRTIAATTFRCGKPGSDKSLLACSRILGRAAPKASNRPNLFSSRTLAITGMIAVLLEAFYIAAHGLDVAVFAGANPYVFPGWGNHEGVNPLQCRFIPRPFQVRSKIVRTFAAAFSNNAWILSSHAAQVR